MGSYPPVPQPEILPPNSNPNYGYAPPPPPVRRKRPSWAAAPATYLLVGINCAVFIGMVLSGVSIGNPTVDQLLKWGADNTSAVLLGGEWWRIDTAMFVHVGIIHLATNMWCLWNLALLAEPLMGSIGVFAVYILTGAAGNLLSVGFNWYKYHDVGVYPVGAGASGAVFGIAGALIVLLKSDRLPIDPMELKRLRKSVIYFAVLNLVISFGVNLGSGFTGVNVDNAAHVGGCLCGLLFAAPMVPRIGSSRESFLTRLQVAIGMVVLVLTLFAFYISRLGG